MTLLDHYLAMTRVLFQHLGGVAAHNRVPEGTHSRSYLFIGPFPIEWLDYRPGRMKSTLPPCWMKSL